MNETDIFNPMLDKIYEVAISGIMFAGILGNSFSLYYFLTATSINNNSEFFSRLYSVASLVDLLISINSIPVAEAAFRRGRNGVMFANSGFCGVWSVLCSLLWAISAFQLKPMLAWIVPTVVAIGWLSTVGILKTTGFISFSNRRDTLACTLSTVEDLTQVTNVISRKKLLSAVTIALIRMILPSSRRAVAHNLVTTIEEDENLIMKQLKLLL